MNKNKIAQQITEYISQNTIVLFMKGTANFPQCGFSAMVVDILRTLNIKFKDINVLVNNDLRQGIKEYSDWPTIPQLYVNKEFIGGCDIIKELYQTGDLKKLVTTTM